MPQTATIVLPEGYANAEDFARDCGFKLVDLPDPKEPERLIIERLRATLLNIQALAERGFPTDCSNIAKQCRHTLGV